MNFCKNLLHFLTCFFCDKALTCSVVAVFSCVGDGVSHLCETALVDKVNDELHFVDTFKVCHFGFVACVNESIEACLHKLCNTAAKNCLFAEEVCFCFFSEACFKNTCSTCADTSRISKSYVLSSAGVVLVNCDKRRNTLTFEVLASYCVTGALRSDHNNVDVLCRLNEVKVDIETVSEAENVAFLHVRSNLSVVNISCKFIGNEHHNYVCCLCRIFNFHYLEVRMCCCKRLSLCIVTGVSSKTNYYVYAGFCEVFRVCVALRTETDNCYCFTVKDRKIAILIIILLNHCCILQYELVIIFLFTAFVVIDYKF